MNIVSRHSTRTPQTLAGARPQAASSPVLTPEALRDLAHQVLDMTTADFAAVQVNHVATGIMRVSQNRVRLTNSGDTLVLRLATRFGRRGLARLGVNQLDPDTLRQAVAYAERVAHEESGDPAVTPDSMPIPPRKYLPNSTWHETTVAALEGDRHAIVSDIVQPLVAARLVSAAFVGVWARSTMFATKQGILAVGRETDAELTITGWNRAGGGGVAGAGWAGEAARDWASIDPAAVAAEAVRLTQLAANPVALEPGRRVAILGPPAMAQIVRAMGGNFGAQATHQGDTPLSGRHLDDKVLDDRISMSSDPNDSEGGYLPFNESGDPLRPMTWIEQGRFKNLAYGSRYAAFRGVAPSNDSPESLRFGGGTTSLEEMIANCKEGIYVNRLANIEVVDGRSGQMMGVTSGGCFLVKDGKITKAVKDFRFLDAPYAFLNRLEAIGPPMRAPFGYAPWHGEWPIAPTIVPPVMVRDFNFNALADAV